MADKGIIFSGPMVRALLEGRKTQTRRLYKPGWGLGGFVNLKEHGDPDGCYSGRPDDPASWGWPYAEDGACDMSLANWPETSGFNRRHRLYVRENFYQFGGPIAYAADGPPEFPRKMTPCIHMPRYASRLWLRVTDVRVQRLQDITEADCLAEGPQVKGYANFGAAIHGSPSSLDGVMVHTDHDHVYATPRAWYRELWDSLHTKPGERWEDNPWVVAVTFEVNRGNIDQSPPVETSRPVG